MAERRCCLITGASAGIGEQFAEVFASHGWDLVLTARREDRLRTVADRLQRAHGITAHVIVADLADPKGPSLLCDTLASRGLVVDGLVNNAGFGVPGLYHAQPWETQAELLQVLVVAVAELTHRLLPGMLARGFGRIINVASLAGLVPAPAGHTLYPAAKALVIRFTESLAEEVRGTGVLATVVCPGFTYTEFHDVSGTRAQVSKLPGWMWLHADRVAREGYDAVTAGTPVYVNGPVPKVLATVARLFPGLFQAMQRRISWTYRKTH